MGRVKEFADFKHNTSVDLIRVPKARTSGKWLPIDISFVYGAREKLKNLNRKNNFQAVKVSRNGLPAFI